MYCAGNFYNMNLQSDTDLALKNDADLQAELIPQELNPEFLPGKESPWRAVIPIASRRRRDTDVASAIPESSTGVSHNVKLYSRIASCVALAVAAVIEIVLYVLEFYA